MGRHRHHAGAAGRQPVTDTARRGPGRPQLIEAAEPAIARGPRARWFRFWLRAVMALTILLGILVALQQFGIGRDIPFLGAWHGWAGAAVTVTAVVGALIRPHGARRLVGRGIAFTILIVFLLGLGFWLGWWNASGLSYGGVLAVHAIFAFGAAILLEVNLSGVREPSDD